jgi:hypothetical protein
VKRTPQIVYHVGFCESRTGALVEALVDLDAATAIARAAHADDVVSAAQSELADVKKRVPTLEARLKGDPSTATRFVVDGSAIALSVLGTAMPLDPGEHTVTIELASGARVTGKATLAEREAKVVELVALEAPSPAAAPVPAPAPAPPPTSVPVTSSPSAPPMTEHRASTIEWVAIGVGAALTVGGASFFAAARVKEGSLNTACPSHTGCDPSLQGSYDTATTFNSVGLGLGAVGLATAALGVSVLVLRPSATTSTAIVVSPRGVGLTTSF